ncbi:MAG: FHA domain-containing protein [Planctomycetaceae bacterium]|nr:FHA domain-containing protein [Planctomycetaceae bacterium]
MPALQHITAGSRREVVRLYEGLTTIGRSERNHIRLNLPDVSRHHASITNHNNNNCVLENRSITSQTLVNRNPVVGEYRLIHGDIIRIGRIELMFLDSNDVDDMSDDGGDSAGEFTGLKIAQPSATDPDDSIRRKLAKTGQIDLPSGSPDAGLSQHKVVSRIAILNEPEAAIIISDPQAKLALTLRMIDDIAMFLADEFDEILSEAIYREFPGCEQIVICVAVPSNNWTEVLVNARHKASGVVNCSSCISHAIFNAEALLLYDLWKGTPQDRPAISELDRMSVMVAPMQSTSGVTLGAIQLNSSPHRERFSPKDLERLVLVARLLSLTISVFLRRLANGSNSDSPADPE